MYDTALRFLADNGVCPWSAFPYNTNDCSALPSSTIKDAARQYKIAAWASIGDVTLPQVKGLIASGFPVLIGVNIYPAFTNLCKGQIFTNVSGSNLGGHAVVAIAYDDNKNAFKIMNSWGKKWGDDGFAWIAYSVFQQIVIQGYIMFPMPSQQAASVASINAFVESESTPRTNKWEVPKTPKVVPVKQP